MTIGLTYNSDLSRVQLALSGLLDGTLLVERSTNQLFWETVRGGLALPVVGGAAALDDFEFSPDVQNFYRATPIGMPLGLLLDGTAGSYASTPSSTALNISGDVVLTADVTLDSYNPGVEQALVAKYRTTDNERSYMLIISSGGVLRMNWSQDGAVADAEDASELLSTVAVDGERIVVRAWLNTNLGGAGTEHAVTFYTAPSLDGPWTQLGTQQVDTGVVTLHSSPTDVTVGAFNDGASGLATGTIHAAQVWEGTLSSGELNTGTMRADPVFEDQASVASFSDDAGNLWSVNGTAVIVGVESDSITPSLAGQVWLKSIRFPFLNRPVRVLNWAGIGRASRTGVFDVKGRSLPISVHDLRGSPQFELTIVTDDLSNPVVDGLEQARDLDLMLAASGTLLIHSPPELPVPGGYVTVGNTEQDRIVRHGTSPFVFTLPCTVEAPPGPDVVGTTMTWGTVFNLYGSWGALLAANPTWGDLLATVGSEDDLVVL